MSGADIVWGIYFFVCLPVGAIFFCVGVAWLFVYGRKRHA